MVLQFAHLSDCLRRGIAFPKVTTETTSLYETASFVSQCMSLYDSGSKKDSNQLLGRVRGCIQRPSDLRGLAFELLVATHLVRNNSEIFIPSDGTFDWLARRDGVEFEVECKSISHDKGRKIHRRPSLEFAHEFSMDSKKLIRSLTAGLVLRITVNGNTLRDRSTRLAICRQARESLLRNNKTSTREATITVTEFDASKSPFTRAEIPQEEIRNFVDKNFGPTNAHLFSHYTPNKGALIVILESSSPDNLIGEIFETIGLAMKDQLTATRSGIICVKLEGITGDELAAIGSRQTPPSPLTAHAGKFLAEANTKHLAQLGFFADSDLITRDTGAISREGRTYYFRNENCAASSDPRIQLFDPDRNSEEHR